MSIAEKEKFSDYASFNEFFIRPLKENARPINQIQPHFAALRMAV